MKLVKNCLASLCDGEKIAGGGLRCSPEERLFPSETAPRADIKKLFRSSWKPFPDKANRFS